MTENFAECFIDHRHVGFAAKAVAKFAFHHGERGFHIRPFVIMREKFRFPEKKSSGTSSPMFHRPLRDGWL